MTEYSQTLTSPKSQQNIGLAFGGGSKYGVAGMSYQDIGEMRGPKLTSLKKVYFWVHFWKNKHKLDLSSSSWIIDSSKTLSIFSWIFILQTF